MRSQNIKKEVNRKAAVYCRVSTVDQGRADFSSLDAQENMLTEHCKQKGWIIHKVYVDTKSGKTLERPALENLLRDAESKQFDVVVSTKLDRLSRSVKDFLELDDRLRSFGVDIVITTQSIDTTTPAGQMQRTIMIAFAQFEREMIAERTRESAYVRAQKGFWLGGRVPMGYDLKDKKLVVNQEEALLVNKIFEMYLESPSTKTVARQLSKQGFKTKIRITRDGKKSGGNDFNYQLIHDILRNKTYLGLTKVNKETFKGLHEQIISDSLFNRVQKRIDESNIDTFATYEGSPLLLLGITKCGYCGANLTTYFANNGKNPEKHYYYKCTTIIKRGADKCPSRLVPARDLEGFTKVLMLHTIEKEDFFDAITSQIKDNSNVELDNLKKDKQILLGNLSAIEKRIDNVINNITDEVLGKDVKKKLGEKLESLEKEKKGVKQSISDLDGKIIEIENNKFHKSALKQVLKSFDELYQGAPPEQKRQMLKTIISEIKVTAKRGEKEGILEFKIRGNGTLEKSWNALKYDRGANSTPHVVWLPD